jgi:hypothetical protein
VLPAAKKRSSGLNLLLEATQNGNPNPTSTAITLVSIASMVHNNTGDQILLQLGLLTGSFQKFASEMKTISVGWFAVHSSCYLLRDFIKKKIHSSYSH